MKIDFEALKKAVVEMVNEKGQEYAEDCIKGMLKLKNISVDEYSQLMEVIYE